MISCSIFYLCSGPSSLESLLLEASTSIHSGSQFKTLKEVLALVVQASMISEDKLKIIDARADMEMKWLKKNRKELAAWFDRFKYDAVLVLTRC